jgi:hypothetical protein
MAGTLIGIDAAGVDLFQPRSAAAGLGPDDRAGLALAVLGRREPITRLAHRHGVSRQFLYRQGHHARQAVAEAFAPSPDDDQKVLFHLPVTKAWLHQLALAQVLIGHTSYRGVQEILEAVFDCHDLSLGSIHNLLARTVTPARALNDAQDLRAIRIGAHDEIYQNGRPVLVGADLESTYCYLLADEATADETTWGVHLLDLTRQGLAPDYTVADGGRALRAGQAVAWPTTPCHGDVFHAEQEFGCLVAYATHRAEGAITARAALEARMARARARGEGTRFSKRLALARQAETRRVALADDLRLLADWLQQDVLALAGPPLNVRRDLFDFVVRELAAREPLCPHRIGPVRRALEHQRDDLLAFAAVLEERFADLAQRFAVPVHLVRQVSELQGLNPTGQAHWSVAARLRHQLPDRFHRVQEAVRQLLAETPRASSVIENLNSRLRNYFFLRRDLGPDYLDLLRFFLNHRRFLRSEHPERVGRSPAELLSGRPHPHWLELLGFQRFHRN